MSLYQSILAHLSALPTQNARLIRLHTPLGKDVLVAERVEVSEAIGPLPEAERPPGTQTHGQAHTQTDGQPGPAATRLTIHALSGDTHLELKSLIGQRVRLDLLTSEANAIGQPLLRPWSGHVTQAALLGSDGGLVRYRLVVEPWLAFLAHNQDSWVFQDKSVIDIIEDIFADYASQGGLQPQWRWDLIDASLYPRRSLSIQYQESDLAYIHRLLREEGLFYWWEHRAEDEDGNAAEDAQNTGQGSHTLVIADHNGAFSASAQPRVRFTQSGASLKEDSLTQVHHHARVRTASLHLASADYRTLDLRAQNQNGRRLPAGLEYLNLADVPGQYAYEDNAQGARLAQRQIEALDALAEQGSAVGSVRAAAAGSHFTLCEHPVFEGDSPERDRFVVLQARHVAHNNLRADHQAQVNTLLGQIAQDKRGVQALMNAGKDPGNTGNTSNTSTQQTDTTPLHQCWLHTQPLVLPVRRVNLQQGGLENHPFGLSPSTSSGQALSKPSPTPFDRRGANGGADLADVRLHPRPTVQGVQTAIVVGLNNEAVHTDRDQRIQVQFHWQRGQNSGHRLEHKTGQDNAPASGQAWVRVATPVAGQNWGSAFTPRLGQEVLIAFIQGDIDRPVVVGSVYNGQGQVNAQGNQVACGGSGATGNAPAFFAGSQASTGSARTGERATDHQGHGHNAVLSGLKSQELSNSKSGTGGHNQLVFDDTPRANRIELSTTQAATRLQLGHLLNQNDNQRLGSRGHGLELATRAWGAVRAGAGLLVSTYGKPASTAGGGQQMDSTEPLSRIQSGQELLHTLAQSAQDHQAHIAGEPPIKGATEKDKAQQLAVEQGLWATQDSLKGKQTMGSGADPEKTPDHPEPVEGQAQDDRNSGPSIGGGQGSVTAWSRPDLVLASPAGILHSTPKSGITSAGNTMAVVAGQDSNHLAAQHWAMAAKDGIVLYTYGQASNKQKPNQETGIQLHAASGNVNSQSQSGSTHVVADKAVNVSSAAAGINASAPQHILLTAGGAGIRISGGNITLSAPGTITFKAGMKNFTGGSTASATYQRLSKPDDIPFDDRFVVTNEAGASVPNRRYQIIRSDGGVLSGVTNAQGQIEQQRSFKGERIQVKILGKS